MTLFNELKTQFIILVATVLIIVAAVLVVYSNYLVRQRIDFYQFFFKLWKSNQPNNYLLTYSSSGCVYTIRVTNGTPTIIKKVMNGLNCEYIPGWLTQKHPMDKLFESLIQTSKLKCGPNGCQCDNIKELAIRFDKKLGYIHSWTEINSGNFTPFITASVGFSKACTLIYTVPMDFTINIRPI